MAKRSKQSSEPEVPRVEPEIIPPDRSDWRQSRPRPNWGGYGFDGARGTQRIYVTRLGPFGFGLLLLVLGILAAAFLVAVVGAVLIWLPVVALFVLAVALFRLFLR